MTFPPHVRRLALVAVVAGLVVSTACGSDDDAASTTTTEAADDGSTTTATTDAEEDDSEGGPTEPETGAADVPATVEIPVEDFNVGGIEGLDGEPCTIYLSGGATSCYPGSTDEEPGPWEVHCDVGVDQATWESGVEEGIAANPDTTVENVPGDEWTVAKFIDGYSQALVAWDGNIGCSLELIPISPAVESLAVDSEEAAQQVWLSALEVLFTALPEVDEREQPTSGTAVPGSTAVPETTAP